MLRTVATIAVIIGIGGLPIAGSLCGLDCSLISGTTATAALLDPSCPLHTGSSSTTSHRHDICTSDAPVVRTAPASSSAELQSTAPDLVVACDRVEAHSVQGRQTERPVNDRLPGDDHAVPFLSLRI